MRSRTVPHILLAVILVLSFGLNARVAAHPRSAYQSADERSYGKLAVDMLENSYLNGQTIRLDGSIRMAPR